MKLLSIDVELVGEFPRTIVVKYLVDSQERYCGFQVDGPAKDCLQAVKDILWRSFVDAQAYSCEKKCMSNHKIGWREYCRICKIVFWTDRAKNEELLEALK